MNIRWPAEWEPHSATWIAWPHHEPDWPGKLAAIPWVYAEIVRVIAAHEPVEILCHDEATAERADRALAMHDVRENFRLHLVETDRVWTRDSGGTGVLVDGVPQWARWRFNAWAKYDNYSRDEQVGQRIAEISGLDDIEAQRPDGAGRLVLEGGAIETNGAGVMLTTEECLLSPIQERNPGLDRAGYEEAFRQYLGIDRTIWLGNGCSGDDTHGHVDDIARFVSENVVALAYEANASDENHDASEENERRLHEAGVEVVRLPYPRPIIMDGTRLPASYANFYIANGVVLVPTFNDVQDRVALDILADLFPDRDVIGIHAVDLVWGLGTLHCLTQQQPRGA